MIEMSHAKSLRTVGESLEALGVKRFVLVKAGRGYLVHSIEPPARLSAAAPNAGIGTGELQPPSGIHTKLLGGDGVLHYDASYVSWWEAQGKRKRRARITAQASVTKTLGQLMRALGGHLDRMEPHEFTISWEEDAVGVNCRMGDGRQVQESFSIAKLRELTLNSRVRRAPRK